MNLFFNRTLFVFLSLASLLFTPACVDQEFDEPPVNTDDPDIEANATISDLKALFIPGSIVEIEEDLVVDGIVVADDRSGNYFRSFIFQDETGGIEVRINLTDAYNFYPIGRRLFIKCKGLVIGDNNGSLQLGGYIFFENNAPQLGDIVALDDHLLRGMLVGDPDPAVRTINQLGPLDVNTLVKLENVEFASFEVGLTFSDPLGRQTINRTLQDCSGNSIIVRTSGFANFAAEPIPGGNGSLTGIYSVFGSSQQFFIRTLDDVQLDSTRCSGGGGNAELMDIGELRDLFESGTGTAPDERKIRGLVISDRITQNIVGQNLILQDASGGIVVRFQGNHSFALGEEVEVIVSGQELSEFNGLLQVNDLPNELASSLGVGTPVSPRVATVAEVLSNSEAWESTLVRMNGVTISGSSTLSGGTTVTDASGSIDMFTRSGATFAGDPVPAGTVDLVAIVSQFNEPQLIIRNTDDIIGGGGGDPEIIGLAELRDLFEGGAQAVPAAKKVRGVVTSNKDNGSITGRNMVLQDETGGIIVRFTDDNEFALGEDVEILVSGQELSEFNGLLQINNVPNTSAVSFGPVTLPEPRGATVQEVIDNLEDWESTLVRIENASFPDGGAFNGEQTVTDGTASIVMFTRSGADFSSAAVPAGTVKLTAIVSQFNVPQLTIRSLDDIE